MLTFDRSTVACFFKFAVVTVTAPALVSKNVHSSVAAYTDEREGKRVTGKRDSRNQKEKIRDRERERRKRPFSFTDNCGTKLEIDMHRHRK